MNKTIYAISTQSRINPTDPLDAEYYDRDQTCYIMKHTDSSRIIATTSFGVMNPDYIGQRVEMRHGSDGGSYRGHWMIIGAVQFANDHRIGEVPARKLPHWVFK